MNRAIRAPASQHLAFAATVVIVLAYCASMHNHSMAFVSTVKATDVATPDSAPKSKRPSPEHHAYVSVRLKHPELLTGFRITLGKDRQFPDVEYVRAKPFRVEVKRVDQWHDAFLEALEFELTRRVAQNDLRFAQVIWGALRSNTNANSSFDAIQRQLPDTAEGIDSVLRRISKSVADYAAAIRGPHGNYANAKNPFGSHLVNEIPTLVTSLERHIQGLDPAIEKEDNFSLMNGSPASLSAAGLIIWERMRFRLIRGRSALGRELVRQFGFH